MSAEFFRTARSLAADRFGHRAPALIVACVLLAAWALWAFLARVPVYVVSAGARLEVARDIHPVESPVAGRIVSSGMVLGAEVKQGEVLAELDASVERLQLAELRARLDGYLAEIEALRRELVAEETAAAEATRGARVAMDEARAHLRQAEASERLALDQEARMSRLHSGGEIADVDLLRVSTEAQRKSAEAESARLAVERLTRERATGESDRQVRIERLNAELARLEGSAATARVSSERIEHEVDRRRIRAPASGRLADVGPVGSGTMVQAGTRLGAVVPGGEIRAVADFAPREALGRVRSGQPARMRLEGFNWTQYGSLEATVAEVAGEVRDGHVRVELVVEASPDSLIPREHGLPGTVEVEVERVSPATLILRSAGRLVTHRGAEG